MVGDVARIDVVGGRYRLDHLLGRGGMGAVWAGYDTILNRPVAVKMLRDELGPDAPLLRQRLLAEARAAAAVRHPNLVSTFDAVSDDGTFALVMERLPGPSLADRLADGPLTTAEARTLALDVLGGLDAVHEAGLVHRDVKPANVLRSADGRWMLVDFGIAKNLLADDDLTLTGTTVGTPAYLAPEQLNGRRATPSADLWAVGVMLYEALSGRLPFTGDTPFAVAYSVQADSPEPLSAVLPDADPAISGTVERALRKSADDRFGSASAMAASLRPHPVPDAIPAPPPEAEPAPAPAPPETVVTGEKHPASRRVLAVPLVLASFVMAVAMAVTLGGGGGDGDPGTPTTEATAGDGNAAPTPGDGSPSDGATASSVPGRATGTGSRRPGAATPGGGTPEDSSLTAETTTTVPPTDDPGTGSPTTAPPTTTPPTTTPPTTTPPTTTPPTTEPPVTLPPVTLPELPPGLGGLLPRVPGPPG